MPKQHVDIFLFVEHVARELDVACVVKYLIDKRYGLSLEIASTVYNLPEILKKYRAPRVVVTPYCYSAADQGIRDILPAWPCATFVNLAYEQIFQKINRSVKAPRDDFARCYVLHHAWSESFVDYLAEYGTPKENTIVNGNPSLPLYQPPYAAYFDTRKKLAETFQLDPDRRWVFVPENYGAAFYSNGRVQKYIRLGATEAEAYGYRNFAMASLREAARWFKQAAEQGDAEVIVRPRPATTETDFTQVCVEAAGPLPEHLHIIKGGTVREWIMASDAVASSYSTTLIEAAVACRPIFMLMPIPFPEFLYNDWYELVPNVKDFSSFMAAVDGRAPADSWCLLQEWATSTMLSRGDVISNLLDLLAAVYWRQAAIPDRIYNSGRPKPVREASLTYRSERKWRGLVRKIFAPVPGQSEQLSPKHDQAHEHDEIHDSDIAKRVARWQQVLKSQGNSA